MTIHFHDVSSYQGDYHPTGPTIAKATEGTGYTDARFATNRARTLTGGWPFVGYHFLRHGNVAVQADHAVAVVGHGQPLMLDIETAVDNTDCTLADALAFADFYAQASGGGRVTLAYIPHWYWQGHWGSPSLTGLAQRGIKLISSYYVPYSDSGPGWDPYGGMTPTIWQYTSTPLDTNAFKGTEAQLAAVFAGGDNDMTPDQAQQLDNVANLIDALNAMSPTIRFGKYKGQPAAEVVALLDIQQRLDALELAQVADHQHAGGVTGPAQPLDGA